MEKKNGEFACFKKTSKKGTNYFNGTLTLDGKEYWISIFNKHSQKGEQYLSGIVEPKKPVSEEKTDITADQYKNAKDGSVSSFDDEIPW